MSIWVNSGPRSLRQMCKRTLEVHAWPQALSNGGLRAAQSARYSGSWQGAGQFFRGIHEYCPPLTTANWYFCCQHVHRISCFSRPRCLPALQPLPPCQRTRQPSLDKTRHGDQDTGVDGNKPANTIDPAPMRTSGAGMFPEQPGDRDRRNQGEPRTWRVAPLCQGYE